MEALCAHTRTVKTTHRILPARPVGEFYVTYVSMLIYVQFELLNKLKQEVVVLTAFFLILE